MSYFRQPVISENGTVNEGKELVRIMIDKFVHEFSKRKHENQWMICCAVLVSIICLNVFDGIAMVLGGIERNSAPEVLFMVNYVPIAYQGIFLILISLVHAYGIGAKNRALDISLMIGVMYYALWTTGIFWSWFYVDIQSLCLFSKSAFLGVLYLIVARYSPHPHRS